MKEIRPQSKNKLKFVPVVPEVPLVFTLSYIFFFSFLKIKIKTKVRGTSGTTGTQLFLFL